MPQFFTVAMTSESAGVATLRIGFADPADNTRIVPDAVAAITALRLAGGRGVHFNGPASLPVAMALAHAVAHLYGYVACFDPKLGGYVVAISHTPDVRPGQLLPAAGDQ
ncbi:MAG TPA: CRISPR-associated protein Csx3 [Bryobacteraceae bacterium]|nr:CRISPR-associated protein Csx3 [Bryobacteraceae bacterium]